MMIRLLAVALMWSGACGGEPAQSPYEYRAVHDGNGIGKNGRRNGKARRG